MAKVTNYQSSTKRWTSKKCPKTNPNAFLVKNFGKGAQRKKNSPFWRGVRPSYVSNPGQRRSNEAPSPQQPSYQTPCRIWLSSSAISILAKGFSLSENAPILALFAAGPARMSSDGESEDNTSASSSAASSSDESSSGDSPQTTSAGDVPGKV